MELSGDVEEHKRSSVMQSTSKRVKMIFSVMASPNRIDILRILNSKGPLTYSELKALAGFRSKKESGKFAYHLRKLLRQSLVALNKSERRYTVTNPCCWSTATRSTATSLRAWACQSLTSRR